MRYLQEVTLTQFWPLVSLTPQDSASTCNVFPKVGSGDQTLLGLESHEMLLK